MAGAERRAKATIRRYVMAALSGMRGACVICVRVVTLCSWVSCAGIPSEIAWVRFSFLTVRGHGFGEGE